MTRDRFIDWFGGPIVLGLVALILLGFGLAGCGGSSKPDKIVPHVMKVTGDQVEWHVVKVQMPDDRTILCVTHDVSYGQSISCNWEAYNKKGS